MLPWSNLVFRTGRLARPLAVACIFTLLHPGIFASAQAPGNPTEAAQDGTAPGQRRNGGYAGMGRTGGEVTAISGNTLTVKGENGRSVQIVTTDNTRVVKASGPVKIGDLHVGDGLIAIGNLDPTTGTLHAAMVIATDAAELKAMRDNLGKTYITGKVTAIDLDDARMTVERPDHVAQTIGFDESTSFKRAIRGERGGGGPGNGNSGGGPGGGPGNSGGGGAGWGMGGGMGLMAGGSAAVDRLFANSESITLADIRVGDNVTGTGGLKKGVFVPVRLIASTPRGPRGPRQHGPETGGSGDAGKAESAPAPSGPGAQ